MNKYTLRTAKAESACFICYRSTRAILVSDAEDWFYACRSHLYDPSFCALPSPSPSPAATPSPTTGPAATSKGNAQEAAQTGLKSLLPEIWKSLSTEPVKKKAEPKPPVALVDGLVVELHRDLVYLRQAKARKAAQEKRAMQMKKQLLKSFPEIPSSSSQF